MKVNVSPAQITGVLLMMVTTGLGTILNTVLLAALQTPFDPVTVSITGPVFWKGGAGLNEQNDPFGFELLIYAGAVMV